jgi:hypothetical protein
MIEKRDLNERVVAGDLGIFLDYFGCIYLDDREEEKTGASESECTFTPRINTNTAKHSVKVSD